MTTVSQRSFSSGELNPTLHSRVDFIRYLTGLKKCKDVAVVRQGGLQGRPGTAYIDSSPNKRRLLPFILSNEFSYLISLEAGGARFYQNSIPLNIADTPSSPFIEIDGANRVTVYNDGPHNLEEGQKVTFSGWTGADAALFNDIEFFVIPNGSNAYYISFLGGVGLSPISSSYVAGSADVDDFSGIWKSFELPMPYTEDELFDIRYAQSGDILSLAHSNHPPRDVLRVGASSFRSEEVVFDASTTSGIGVSSAFIANAGSEEYQYKFTTTNLDTGVESSPLRAGNSYTITAVTYGNPTVLTISGASNFVAGDEVYIIAFNTELDSRYFTVSSVSGSTITIAQDSTDYSPFTSGSIGGTADKVTSAALSPTNTIRYIVGAVADGTERAFNVYREDGGVFGLLASVNGNTYTDVGIEPDTSVQPPRYRSVFEAVDRYPATVAYAQQRRIYGNINRNQELLSLSKIGDYRNFSSKVPVQADTSFSFNLAGRRLNDVRHILDVGRVIVFTGTGEWSLDGENGVITPTTINPTQSSYNGASKLPPLVIDSSAIYTQARGSIIRDLSYNFSIDGYQGDDLTIFSSHLFEQFVLEDWTYQQVPNSIIWSCRDDGKVVGLTYIKSQQIIATHQHDFNGFVESIQSIPEANEDRVYLSIRKTINGVESRHLVRMETFRPILDVRDDRPMDFAGTFDGNIPAEASTGFAITVVSPGAYAENNISLTAAGLNTDWVPSGGWTTDNIGDEIHVPVLGSFENVRFKIVNIITSSSVQVQPYKTLDGSIYGTHLDLNFAFARDTVAGLDYLEGESVCVIGDGHVVASPNNPDYDVVTVTGGQITLPKPYAKIHVGLSFTPEIETLDIDTANGETLVGTNKLVTKLYMRVENTRGLWAGNRQKEEESLIDGLQEIKNVVKKNYLDPNPYINDIIEVDIPSEWNRTGNILVRQIDPLSVKILSIHPAGKFAFR